MHYLVRTKRLKPPVSPSCLSRALFPRALMPPCPGAPVPLCPCAPVPLSLVPPCPCSHAPVPSCPRALVPSFPRGLSRSCLRAPVPPCPRALCPRARASRRPCSAFAFAFSVPCGKSDVGAQSRASTGRFAGSSACQRALNQRSSRPMKVDPMSSPGPKQSQSHTCSCPRAPGWASAWVTKSGAKMHVRLAMAVKAIATKCK
jgi:hypothetical protein